MATTNEIKDAEQGKAISAWIHYKCWGTLELCTSFGKTFTALKAAMYYIQSNPNFRVLVLTPTEVIRDDVWIEEAKQWGLEKYYHKHFRMECIQTARNWVNTQWDMVIGDEFHNYLSPENRKFFLNNRIDKLLGLTAKIPADRWDIAKQICPVIYRMTIQEAKLLGIVSKYTVANLAISFTPKEKLEYAQICNRYNYYESLLGGKHSAYNNSRNFLKNGSTTQKQQAAGFQNQMRLRTQKLYAAQNKLKVINEALDMPKFKDKLAIIFTQTKQVAHSLSSMREDTVHYYSPASADKKKGLYISKQERLENLVKFNDPTSSITRMVAVMALNEGVSIPKISLNFIHSGTNSEKDFIQRVGRTVRLADADKHALIVNCYIKGTQEEVWVNSRLGKFKEDSKWVSNLLELSDLIN